MIEDGCGFRCGYATQCEDVLGVYTNMQSVYFHIFVKYWYHFDVTIFKFRKISEIPKKPRKKRIRAQKKTGVAREA